MPEPQPRSAAAFPSTRWSRVIGHPDAPSSARRADLELLAQAYWRPVYAYVKARGRLSHDDALEQTQEFFVALLEGNLLATADPSRGRFRALIKTALGNHLTDRARSRAALRRGGAVTHLSIDFGDDEDRLAVRDASDQTPDQILDARWRRELLERALREVGDEFAREGRRVYFEMFREYYVTPDPEIDYAALANRHGVALHDVSNYLRKAKQRYRARLRQLVLETVTCPEDLDAELRWLFGA